jgi:transposase-like protein
MVEGVNAEIKRRTKVVGAFPGRESLLRPVGSILMDTNEELQERYNPIDDRMTSIQIRVLQTIPRKEPPR